MYITTQELVCLIDSIVNNIKVFTDYPTPQYPNHTIVSGKEEIWNCLATYKKALGDQPRKMPINIRCICKVDNKGNIHWVTLVPDKGNELTLSDELANKLKLIITKHIKWNEIKERMLSELLLFSILCTMTSCRNTDEIIVYYKMGVVESPVSKPFEDFQKESDNHPADTVIYIEQELFNRYNSTIKELNLVDSGSENVHDYFIDIKNEYHYQSCVDKASAACRFCYRQLVQVMPAIQCLLSYYRCLSLVSLSSGGRWTVIEVMFNCLRS